MPLLYIFSLFVNASRPRIYITEIRNFLICCGGMRADSGGMRNWYSEPRHARIGHISFYELGRCDACCCWDSKRLKINVHIDTLINVRGYKSKNCGRNANDQIDSKSQSTFFDCTFFELTGAVTSDHSLRANSMVWITLSRIISYSAYSPTKILINLIY